MADASTPEPPPPPPPTLPDAEIAALREAGRAWTAAPARSGGPEVAPGLDVTETRGRPGEHYVRVVRSQSRGFEPVAPGWLQATPRAAAPDTAMGRLERRLRTVLLGAPLANRQMIHERLNKVRALAVLSSDALSSVAYATEEIILVLAVAGATAVSTDLLPIMGVIAALIAIVCLSYRQTIKAYPQGGGSYIVAKDNLGPVAGLVAGSALMTDYILTVAVSVASGYDQIQSVFPAAVHYRVFACIAVVVLIALANLRGLRQAGNIFAAPTYLFILAILLTIVVNLFRLVTGGIHPTGTTIHISITQNFTDMGGMLLVLLFLKGFSSGCSALTGIEAISDGILAFKIPEWRNARTTLTVMGILCVVMFCGITIGTEVLGVSIRSSADPCYQSVILQQAAHAFTAPLQCVQGHAVFPSSTGLGEVLFVFVGVATTAVLLLAANTSFSDFPRLFFFLARDEYAPHQFRRLGDRLAYSNGIIMLALFSCVLIFVFQGDVSRLIPLYAIGVFVAFTMSQAGMVVRWLRRRELGWKHGLPLNLIGMCMTCVVFVVTAVSKFPESLIILVIVPSAVTLFLAIHRHYAEAREQRTTEIPTEPGNIHPICIVPVDQLNNVAFQSLALARSLSDEVVAVHICPNPDHIALLRARWEAWGNHVPLVIVESPYRSILRPLLHYIDAIDRQVTDRTLVVVLPELVATRWWQQLLHNQFPLRLKAALLFRPGTVLVSVPYHLQKHHRRDADLEAL
ncbi:MAG: APC family permease [Candidatus Dormibacteria bacterium]